MTVAELLDEVVTLVLAAMARPAEENEHRLRQISLSGTGEPTLSPHFLEIVEGIAHLRATRRIPLLKLVLVTNGAGLERPPVQQGLRFLGAEDEVWVKLDAGDQSGMDRLNRPEVSLSQVLANIVELGRRRPIVIQSLFPSIAGAGPAPEQLGVYLACLQQLRDQGVQIAQVQIYSTSKPPRSGACGHLPLRVLSEIARAVRTSTGLRAEVY
jgi:wyosine [tRNA(Phe)-imidazoG37] synthetase (radical SAM superfamily)